MYWNTAAAKTFYIILAIISMALSTSAYAKKSDGNPKSAPESHPEEILVRFKKNISSARMDAIAKSKGAVSVKKFGKNKFKNQSIMTRWRIIKINKNANKKRIIEGLKKNPFVDVVEPNYKLEINILPDDSFFSDLWGLHNTGQTGGLEDSDIDAPEAWDTLTGENSNVVVAVIDTGVDYNHPDLAQNMWTNQGEIPDNGLDDDGNGYIDDVYGYDFYNYDADPWDDHYHGTHVAGTISAVGNNGEGVVGVSWGAKIMAVKFLSSSGGGWTDDAVNAVIYATANGAKIMNNSWGGGGFSQALKDAISEADLAGSLFVAAAGNSSSNNDNVAHYPSNYDVPNVLAVAATDHNDALAYFSSFGATSVDVAAPGVSILSTTPNNSYDYKSGTSMATPHVAGAAALLLAQNPGRTAVGLKQLIMDKTDLITSHSDKTVSGGRINVLNAVGCVDTDYSLSVLEPVTDFSAEAGELTKIRTILSSCGSPVIGATVTASFDNNDTAIDLYDDGTHGDGRAADGIYAGTWNPFTIGPVNITVAASHVSLGQKSKIISGTVADNVYYEVNPEVFSWVDATPGASHALTDDGSIAIPIGFNFKFYGINYDNLVISSNGFLVMGNNTNGAWSYVNESIPNPNIPNNIIAPLWDDLNPSSGGAVYSYLDGVAPNRRLIVSWVDVPHHTLTTGVTFQVILEESTNNIVYQYQDIDFSSTYYNNGQSATSGVEDENGAIGTQISYNQASIQPSTAVRLNYVVTQGNHRPVPVIRAPDYVDIGISFELDGAGSYDKDGDTLSYSWNMGDGTFSNAPVLNHTYSTLGTYTASLVVNDGIIDSTPATKDITVVGPATPTANAGGPYETYEGGFVTLDATASADPDDDALQYYWTFDDGATMTGPVVSRQYHYSGTYEVSLVVSDGIRDSAAVTTSMNILDHFSPNPVISAPTEAHWGVPVHFDGTASYDPEGQPITRYEWRMSGTSVLGTEPTLSYVFDRPGTYTMFLRVFDGYKWSGERGFTITITNEVPVADIVAPLEAHWGQPVTFDGSSSYDPDGDTLTSYVWAFGDGRYGSGATATHSYSSPGEYTATLTVHDGHSNSLKAIHTITITNQSPVATILALRLAHWGQSISFFGFESSDPDGDPIVSYEWDFGDGSSATGMIANHSYAAPGVYTVSLVVSDGQSSSPITSQTTYIINKAPVASISGPLDAHWGSYVQFDGQGSTDPDGDSIVSYNWDFGDGSVGTGATVSHRYAAPGEYTVKLIVNDKFDVSTEATHTITITNDIPVAVFTDPGTGYRLQPLNIRAYGSSDPSDDPLTYIWTFGDGTTTTTTSPTISHTFSEIGTYTVTLVVADPFDQSSPVSIDVTVINSPPVADTGPDRYVYEGDIVYLDASASYDVDGSIVSYKWENLNGKRVPLKDKNTSLAYFKVPNIRSGDMIMTILNLTVTDNEGVESSSYIHIYMRSRD